MESKTIETTIGFTKVKFNIVKLKDCKYFIEDVTYINPVEYTVNLMLYPENSPDADCAVIMVNPSSLLPIEIKEDGSIDNKSIIMCYEFSDDSQYFVNFTAKYIDRLLSILSSTTSDIIKRNCIPMFYSKCMPDEEDRISQTKAEINALIDDYVYKRYSMTNLLCYLNKLRKEERDELY